MTQRGLALVAGWGLAASAPAYYDDVHYALTYYVARQTGYTSHQAFRIASACVSVDWDEQTEPVQMSGQAFTAVYGDQGMLDHIRKFVRYGSPIWYLQLGPMRRASDPRWKFHAFRNEMQFADPVGHGPDAGSAAASIYGQVLRLFKDSVTQSKNPGVFLHAHQDLDPHEGYGTVWGHNPFEVSAFAAHLRHGLPVGSTTDWVAHRPTDVQDLCWSTNSYLQKFMSQVSPSQPGRQILPDEYGALVGQLARLNPAPKPIATEFQRAAFVRYYARSFGVNVDPFSMVATAGGELDRVAAELNVGMSPEDMKKHKDGPEIGKAKLAVDAALRQAGFKDRIPNDHYQYDLDEDGFLDNEEMLDDWVLVGSLSLKMRGSTQPVTVTLKIETKDPAGKVVQLPLRGFQPVLMTPGSTVKWENVPIGEIIVEVRKKNGAIQTQRVTPTKRVNEFGLFVSGTDKAPPPARPRTPTPKPTTPAPSPTPAKYPSFTGTWQTSVGRFAYPHSPMTLSQSGDRVTGSYEHRSGSGTIEGTVKGRELTFKVVHKWTAEGKSYSATGTGKFRISVDGKTFDGTYTLKEADLFNNGWRGFKLNE